MILHSRTPLAETSVISSPSVARALSDWEARVAAAREEGRKAGLAEAAQRINAADARAAQAEQAADAKQIQRNARFEPVLKAISVAAARLEPLQKQLMQESEAECVRLALTIAATILRHELQNNPTWMDTVVRSAIAEIPDRRAVTLRMNPQDATSLNERIGAIINDVPGLEKLEVVGDDTLITGSCILTSRGSRLDASLAGCWERLALRLLDTAPSSDVTTIIQPGDTA